MTAPARPVLTERQAELLHLTATGLNLEEIARCWGVEPVTVRGYSHRLCGRLGARHLAHAVLLACRAGILDGQRRRHGDHAGYEAHIRRGEDPKRCAHGCWGGERAYRAALKARQTPQEAA